MNEPLAEMLRQNLWANLKLLDACAGLTDDQLNATVTGTRGSLADTLVHIATGEGNYIRLLTGERPEGVVSQAQPWPGIDALRRSLETSGAVLERIAAELVEDRQLERQTPGRPPFRGPASMPLVQTFNHGTEHRSQICTILTQLGIEPPVLDGWAWATETGRINYPD